MRFGYSNTQAHYETPSGSSDSESSGLWFWVLPQFESLVVMLLFLSMFWC